MASSASSSSPSASDRRALGQGPPTPAQAELFRAVFGHFPTGVAVITGAGPNGPSGMTANALCSLSLDPLLLLVCFDETARTLPIVRAAGRFGVNVLSAEQHDLSRVFASKRPEAEKFAGVAHRVELGVPVLEHALAWLACDLERVVPGGDHAIGIGAVRAMGHREGEPLIWYRGQYRALHAPDEPAAP